MSVEGMCRRESLPESVECEMMVAWVELSRFRVEGGTQAGLRLGNMWTGKGRRTA